MYRCTRRVSIREPENSQNESMPHRRPTKAERERVITVDLLADWHPYAMPLPEPRSQYDWRYFGTITMEGETGALAWRTGSYGFGAGVLVRELDQWDRIKDQFDPACRAAWLCRQTAVSARPDVRDESIAVNEAGAMMPWRPGCMTCQTSACGQKRICSPVRSRAVKEPFDPRSTHELAGMRGQDFELAIAPPLVQTV